MDKQTEIEILQEAATSRGLGWTIAFEPSFAEPVAFRVIAVDGVTATTPDVIGETFAEAFDCITLTAHMLRRARRAQKGSHDSRHSLHSP